jgi:hypothetical protein
LYSIWRGPSSCGSIFVRILSVVLLSAILVGGTECAVALQSGGGAEAMAQLQVASMVVAVVAIAALIGTGWALTNRVLLPTVLLAGLMVILTQAHERKVAILGKPLAPWDVLEIRQVLALLPTVAPERFSVFTLVVAVQVVVVGVSIYLFRQRPRWPLGACARLLIALASGGLFLALAHWRSPAIQPVLMRLGVVNVVWDGSQNIRRNGLLLSFLLNTRSLGVYQPNYSRQSVLAALGEHQPRRNPVRPENTGNGSGQKYPDVILYMCEALWDPSQLGVRLFRRMWDAAGRPVLYSPAYGGETANVEFEILTGIPVAMFPEDSYPYQHYISRPVETLASLFRDAGYKSVAVHTYHSWFWSRNSVYPLLGFEKFLPLEAMEPVHRQGPFPSDDALVDRLLLELDDGDARPRFAFAITMVTHGPYLYELQAEPRIQALGQMRPETRKELENYATLLSFADQSLGQLVERLRVRNRPTVLLVFGDHLPALGSRQAIYRETGFLGHDAEAPEARARMARVPLAVWTNLPDLPPPRADLGMSFFGHYVLRAAGIEPEGYFALLGDISSRVPVMQRGLIKADGMWYRGRTDPALSSPAKTDTDRIFLLGYDRVLGAGYSQERLEKPARPNP